jgi:hypothetical protein
MRLIFAVALAGALAVGAFVFYPSQDLSARSCVETNTCP